jgi:CHAT domain-containing protein
VFYPAYLDSGSPAQALRQARRSLATEQPDVGRDRSWAAFQVFGMP